MSLLKLFTIKNKRHKRIVRFLKDHPDEIKKIDDGSIVHKLLKLPNWEYKTLIYFIKIYPDSLFIKNDLGEYPIHLLIKNSTFKLDMIKLMLSINSDIVKDNNGNTILHTYILNMKRCIKHNLEFIKYICLNHKEILTTHNNDNKLPIHILCEERSIHYDIVSEIIEILIYSCPELLLMKYEKLYPIELLPTSNYNGIILCLDTKYDKSIIDEILYNIWNCNHITRFKTGMLSVLIKINNRKLITENCERYISNIEFESDIPIAIKNTIKLLRTYYRLLELYNDEYELLFSECDLEEIEIVKEAIRFGRSIEDMVELI